MSDSVTLTVTISDAEMKRVTGLLDKWKGKPLALLMSRIERAALSLTLAPTKARAGRHNLTGETQRGYLVRKVPTRANENASWKMDSNTPQRAYVVAGTRYIPADPYIDEVRAALEPQMVSFIDEQVTRLT